MDNVVLPGVSLMRWSGGWRCTVVRRIDGDERHWGARIAMLKALLATVGRTGSGLGQDQSKLTRRCGTLFYRNGRLVSLHVAESDGSDGFIIFDCLWRYVKQPLVCPRNMSIHDVKFVPFIPNMSSSIWPPVHWYFWLAGPGDCIKGNREAEGGARGKGMTCVSLKERSNPFRQYQLMLWN